MSVLIVSPAVYDYVNTGIKYLAYNRTVNELYSYTASHHFELKDIEKESIRLVKNWMRLNCLSYAFRYSEPAEDLSTFLKFRNTGIPEAFQLLKYLQCIRYQIETETITGNGSVNEDTARLTDQDHKDLSLLEWIISDLKDAIINKNEKYETAKWCEI